MKVSNSGVSWRAFNLKKLLCERDKKTSISPAIKKKKGYDIFSEKAGFILKRKLNTFMTHEIMN